MRVDSRDFLRCSADMEKARRSMIAHRLSAIFPASDSSLFYFIDAQWAGHDRILDFVGLAHSDRAWNCAKVEKGCARQWLHLGHDIRDQHIWAEDTKPDHTAAKTFKSGKPMIARLGERGLQLEDCLEDCFDTTRQGAKLFTTQSPSTFQPGG